MRYMNENKWKVSKDKGQKCPRCKKQLEEYYEIKDGEEYSTAERCSKCRWMNDFDDDHGIRRC